MKQTIKRKDGITYVRETKKSNHYDKNLNIRVSDEILEKLKKEAKEMGISYSKLARKKLEDD